MAAAVAACGLGTRGPGSYSRSTDDRLAWGCAADARTLHIGAQAAWRSLLISNVPDLSADSYPFSFHQIPKECSSLGHPCVSFSRCLGMAAAADAVPDQLLDRRVARACSASSCLPRGSRRRKRTPRRTEFSDLRRRQDECLPCRIRLCTGSAVETMRVSSADAAEHGRSSNREV